jgi:uncharacterized protein
VREQLKLLEELQQVDAKLLETEDALSSLPAKLKSLQNDVARVEALLEKERQQLAEARHYKEELEVSLKSDQEQINKSKSKLTQIRTSKEYMAGQRELEGTRKNIGDREEELIKLMEAIEQFQSSIKVHDEELLALKKHVSEEEQETACNLGELEKEHQGRKTERARMAATVRRDVLAKYETIRRRRGSAVVPARNGVCTGCNMHLPPQLYNTLQKGTTIEHCPSCQRIVYYESEAQPE